jgi:5-methylcytosine-specific restriction endonuclease McrA
MKNAGGRCAHCGSTERLQVDHIVAVAKGGKTEMGNLQILCGRCNSSKGVNDKPKLFRERYGKEIKEVR